MAVHGTNPNGAYIGVCNAVRSYTIPDTGYRADPAEYHGGETTGSIHTTWFTKTWDIRLSLVGVTKGLDTVKEWE